MFMYCVWAAGTKYRAKKSIRKEGRRHGIKGFYGFEAVAGDSGPVFRCNGSCGGCGGTLAMPANFSSSGSSGNTCPPVILPSFSPLTTISQEKSINPK